LGPTIKLNAAGMVNFLFFWTEWLNSTGLGTGAILPATDAANYYLGAYPASEATFLNPAKVVTDTNWVASTIAFAFDEQDPSLRYPGSIGDVIYYSRKNGPYKDSQTIAVDSPFFTNIYSYMNTQYSTFNT
jgi:hypothetical protein